MIRNKANIGWEKRLISLMHPRCDICPPEKCLYIWTAIEEPDLQFHNGTAGAKAYAVHALHAQHGVVVAAPYSYGAV